MTTIERDEHGQTIVSDDVSLVYGCGDTLSEAIHDYVTSLQEYLQILSRHSDRPTQRLFAYQTEALKLIDKKLLQDMGWSDELIKSVEEIANSLPKQTESKGDTEIKIPDFVTTANSSSIDVTTTDGNMFSWPRF